MVLSMGSSKRKGRSQLLLSVANDYVLGLTRGDRVLEGLWQLK